MIAKLSVLKTKNKIICIFIILFYFINAKCQVGSLIQNNNKWNILRESFNPQTQSYDQRTETILFKNNTTINDTLYKNVYQSFKQNDGYSLIGQIREDIVVNKVYFRPINYNKEFLLYDFGLEAGDTTTIIAWHSITESSLALIKVRVDSIVPITLNEINRLKYYISCKSRFVDEWYSTNTWLSGIGDMEGILYSCHNVDLSGGELKQLFCFSVSDSLVFVDQNYNTCYIGDTTATNNLEIQNILSNNDTLQKWNILRESFNPQTQSYDQRTETILFKNNTTINDTLYKNVYQSFKQNDGYSLIGQIREDIVVNKVYFRPINYSREFLLYDFGLETGDTATIISWHSINESSLALIKVRVDSIVPITLNEINRLKYYISCKSRFVDEWYSTNTWLSGIGDMEGILYSCNDIELSGGELKQLLCYSISDSLVFVNQNYNTCYIGDTTATNNQAIQNILFYNDTLQKWNILRESFNPQTQSYDQRTESILFKNDTTINDSLYKNVYQSFKLNGGYSLIGQIREDIVVNKVYFRPINYNREFLLYDFGLEVGDSATIINWRRIDESSLILIKIRVDSIVPVTLNETNRLKYYISSKSRFVNEWISTNTWLSGIGDLEGILYSCNDIDLLGGELKQLLCYSISDSLVFINRNYNTCYLVNTTKINNQEIESVLFYNNTLQKLIIKLDCASTVDLLIVDTFGKTVLTKKLSSNQNYIDLSYIPNGIYIVNVYGIKYNINLKFLKK